jgi:hypothetical protein
MSAFYLPVLLTHSSVTQNNLLDPKYLLILGDMFTGVIIPFLISHPVIKLLSLIWGQKSFITIIIGYLSVLLITFMMVILFLKKNYLQAKLFLIGLTIITASIFFPSMMGVRVERDIAKFVEFSNNATYPQESTHYGIYPAFGLAFLVIAIGTLVKAKHFRIIMIGLIGINIITFVEGSINWNESYVYPQRKRDSQLLKYIPRSNRTEFIYAASKRQNLDIAISNFQQIFRGDIDIRIYMDPNDLVNAVKKYNPSPDQLYFLVEDLSYNIYDYSLVIRSDRQYQSVQPLENLTKLYLSKL